MPHQPRPRFKLCQTCDQLSFVRGSSRDLRCDAPLPEPLEGKCRSRQVHPITLKALNGERREFHAELSMLRTEVRRLGADLDRLRLESGVRTSALERQADERDEEIADLRAQVRDIRESTRASLADLTRRVEAAEARAREAEERAETFRRELLRGGLRPGDLRRR